LEPGLLGGFPRGKLVIEGRKQRIRGDGATVARLGGLIDGGICPGPLGQLLGGTGDGRKFLALSRGRKKGWFRDRITYSGQKKTGRCGFGNFKDLLRPNPVPHVPRGEGHRGN